MLKIHNWSKWQTYRTDRGQPPWIKIHREIMRHIEWVSMTDTERGQLVSIWLLAADHEGKIPDNADLIKKLCFMSERPNLKRFIDLGFIEANGCHDDATLTPERRQHDVPDKNREEKNNGRFNEFWTTYPRKEKKLNSEKIWTQKKLDSIADKILTDIRTRFKNTDKKFIPHPTTYLNGERWNDLVEPVAVDIYGR